MVQPEPPDLRELLDVAQAQTLVFLAQYLPEVGGQGWWQEHVLDKLTMSQRRLVEEQHISSLDRLDLAALLRVFGRNWPELSARLALRRSGQTLVHELGDIRNQVAHAPAAGLDPEDLHRAADTTVRYLVLLGANPEDIALAENARDVFRRIAFGAESPASATNAVNTDDLGNHGSSTGEETPLPAALAVPTIEVAAGVPLPWLQPGAQLTEQAREALSDATYVGIDFGTSTSVVSIVEVDAESGALGVEPISIRQFDRLGREIDQYLIPTCIAWVDGKLLVGSGAAELKTELTEGRDLWTSFKMLLGVDLGPQYPSTELPERQGPEKIERPRDAARVFFSALRAGIEEYVAKNAKPKRIRYTVTVPASFEANQRNDLLQSIKESGIDPEDCVLFDEPNAAFLSYLVGMEQKTDGSRFVDDLAGKPKKVLVFDFGAGTCDISILEVQVDQDRLTSRNLGISRYWALGGDDIDRAIAQEYLLPQLCGNERPQDMLTSREIEKLILPRLKPIGEELKVACSRYAEDKGLNDVGEFSRDRTPRYATSVANFKLQGNLLELRKPHLSLADFAVVMKPFLSAAPAGADTSTHSHGVLEPVDSALEKVGLAPDELDMVLFIGGSSENPLVRQAVAEHVGRFVDCVAPRDMRSHVSQGAAINSFFVHGLGYAPIRPITSEDIYVITSDGGQELVLAAGSPVPSPDINVTEFVVDRDDQVLIELPFCVSRREKLLGVVTLEPPAPGAFKKGSKVRVSCKFTVDKLLSVRASISGGRVRSASILNPLANHELSGADRTMLLAEQALNVAILAGRGRPSAAAALAYARHARNAGQWRKAAEMFEAVEQLDTDSDHATTIDYCYSMAKDRKRSAKWSHVAYQRSPTPMTAFNYALAHQQGGNATQFVRLMEESLRQNPNYTPTLCVYGHHLMDKSDPRGLEYITRAFDQLLRKMNSGSLDDYDRSQLGRCARTLGKTKVLAELGRSTTESEGPDRPYSEVNLVRGVGDEQRSKGI